MRILFVLSIFVLSMFSSCSAQEAMVEREVVPLSAVAAPEIPESVSFADELVVFNRYDLRERIDREIISFCYMHSTSLLMMKRANRYLPEVEKILKEERVPDDFKYLMLIESNANPLSVSGAGAAGLWQFMTTTAKEYGLEVTSTVDERYNVALSTRAACAYLRDAYQKLGTWTAAAASYNAGQAAIKRQLEAQGAESTLDLYLNSETSRYLFRIMAAKVIMSNPEDFGFIFRTDQLYPPFEYSTLVVSTPIADLSQWAKEHKITYQQLRDANLWLRGKSLENKSGKRYEIRILSEKSIYYRSGDTRCFLPCCHPSYSTKGATISSN